MRTPVAALIALWLAIYDNLRVIFILCLNLSSFYRLFQYLNQIRLFQVLWCFACSFYGCCLWVQGFRVHGGGGESLIERS
jgi:hypothetical protein